MLKKIKMGFIRIVKWPAVYTVQAGNIEVEKAMEDIKEMQQVVANSNVLNTDRKPQSSQKKVSQPVLKEVVSA